MELKGGRRLSEDPKFVCGNSISIKQLLRGDQKSHLLGRERVEILGTRGGGRLTSRQQEQERDCDIRHSPVRARAFQDGSSSNGGRIRVGTKTFTFKTFLEGKVQC